MMEVGAEDVTHVCTSSLSTCTSTNAPEMAKTMPTPCEQNTVCYRRLVCAVQVGAAASLPEGSPAAGPATDCHRCRECTQSSLKILQSRMSGGPSALCGAPSAA